MRTVLFVVIFLTSFNLLGEEVSRCFYTHVQEAIELNRERRELYSEETNGKSKKVSRYLIIWEKLIRMKAKKYDRWAQRFQNQGVPFMCEDFVPISDTPEYTPRTTQIPIPYLYRYKPNPKKIKKDLRQKLELGYLPLKRQLELEVEKLSKNPSYDCLLRHIYESLIRSADLAPRYLAKLPAHESKKLDKLMKKYLRLQIFGIGQAIFIDKKARSLQSKGVPILCNDVPAVHLSPWE